MGDPSFQEHVIRDECSGSQFKFVERDCVAFPHYRYLNKDYVDAFFRDGSLQLGTMYGYAATEDHSLTRGDTAEGLIHFYSGDGDFYDIDFPAMVSIPSYNSYIMCSSSQYAKSLADEFETNSCIKIVSKEFYIEISKVMLSVTGSGCTLGNVQYISKSTIAASAIANQWDELSNAAREKASPPVSRTKSIEYANQQEIRAMWEPMSVDKVQEWHAQRQPSAPPPPESAVGQRMGAFEELKPLSIKVPSARQFAAQLDNPDMYFAQSS
jgi:hypothetical protein